MRISPPLSPGCAPCRPWSEPRACTAASRSATLSPCGRGCAVRVARSVEPRLLGSGYTRMADDDKLARVWDIVEKVGVCMFTTRFAGGLRARPLEARPDRAAGLIWFVTDL